MQLTVLSLLMAFLFGFSLFTSDQGLELAKEKEAIKQTIQHYFNGLDQHDVESLKKAFHADAKLFFIRDQKLTQLTQTEWYEGFKSKPASAPVRAEKRIASIEITGNTAVAKTEAEYPNQLVTDYLSLLKVEGRWWIVNKIFYRQEKVAAANR
jgi:hypothetical protein